MVFVKAVAAFGFTSGCDCTPDAVEIPHMGIPELYKPLSMNTLMPIPADTDNTGSIVRPALVVAAVFQRGNVPQIGDGVIRPITVDMVDLIWVNPVDHLPNDAMRYIERTDEMPRPIALRVDVMKRWRARIACIPDAMQAR